MFSSCLKCAIHRNPVIFYTVYVLCVFWGVVACASLLSDGGSELRTYFVLQVIRKGEVSCCWICTACKENEFVQDEFTCKACELGWWPNADLTGRDVSLQTHSLSTGHKENTMCWRVRWQRAEILKVHTWTHIPVQFRVSFSLVQQHRQ